MSKKTHRRIYDNYKAGKITRLNKYDYYIQYNPVALSHTWIIRRPKGGGEWLFHEPLAKGIETMRLIV